MSRSKEMDMHKDDIVGGKLASFRSKLVLPEPTYTAVNPLRKSHARRQPAGHIPRPRNAFILFRCDFVRQKKIPVSVENDHRNISRIVGKIWREMSESDRMPWVKMADEERRNHMKLYPGYRFLAGEANRNKARQQPQVEEVSSFETVTELKLTDTLANQRVKSCPVGAEHISQTESENSIAYGNLSMVRDDLSRRLNRVTLYQSSPYILESAGKDISFSNDVGNHERDSNSSLKYNDSSLQSTSGSIHGFYDHCAAGILGESANPVKVNPDDMLQVGGQNLGGYLYTAHGSTALGWEHLSGWNTNANSRVTDILDWNFEEGSAKAQILADKSKASIQPPPHYFLDPLLSTSPSLPRPGLRNAPLSQIQSLPLYIADIKKFAHEVGLCLNSNHDESAFYNLASLDLKGITDNSSLTFTSDSKYVV